MILVFIRYFNLKIIKIARRATTFGKVLIACRATTFARAAHT